jgi:hypothetical protein
VDFTREPIIETVITPKEGHKLVVRSSKSSGQEEYFADAVEIVAFGHALFFRSLEKPKAFLAPVTDYEIVEVREARVVLKNAGLDRSIKIGGGREVPYKPSRESEKNEAITEETVEQEKDQIPTEASSEVRPEMRMDKKRDRRRHYRKRKGKDDETKEETSEETTVSSGREQIENPVQVDEEIVMPGAPLTPMQLSSLLAPPPTLISETINRYRQNELFKGAFYLTEDEQYKPHDMVQELLNEDDEDIILPHAEDSDGTASEPFENASDENTSEEVPFTFEEGDEPFGIEIHETETQEKAEIPEEIPSSEYKTDEAEPVSLQTEETIASPPPEPISKDEETKHHKENDLENKSEQE